MQFEEFDKKVKQAADQHHPNYDEKAWAKMEKLLDRHMPEKKDRRRIIFFLLAFLLLGGGVWLTISKPWEKSGSTLSSTNNTKSTEATPSQGSGPGVSSPDKKPDETTQPSQADIAKDKTVVSTPSSAPVDITVDKQLKNNTNTQPVANNPARPINARRTTGISKGDELGIEVTDPAKSSKGKKANDKADVVSDVASPPVTTTNNNNQVTDKTVTASKPDVVNPVTNNNDASQNKTTTNTTKKDDTPAQPKLTEKKDEEKKTAKKSSSKKSNSFFFSLSGGPDVSSVGMDNPGKVKLLGGAGFGYTFNNRWTLRTGFYTSSKVYSADPSDYNPKVPPPNPNYLSQIDADCRIYEIPLSLSYNFSRSDKHTAFASAGISSYIMKKEKYVYLYKYPGNPTVYPYTWELKGKNKHYFSVVTLSGGYQHKINKLISIAAEPYIKLPLAGVGFGKIKLNSAGILVSAYISPFKK